MKAEYAFDKRLSDRGSEYLSNVADLSRIFPSLTVVKVLVDAAPGCGSLWPSAKLVQEESSRGVLVLLPDLTAF